MTASLPSPGHLRNRKTTRLVAPRDPRRKRRLVACRAAEDRAEPRPRTRQASPPRRSRSRATTLDSTSSPRVRWRSRADPMGPRRALARLARRRGGCPGPRVPRCSYRFLEPRGRRRERRGAELLQAMRDEHVELLTAKQLPEVTMDPALRATATAPSPGGAPPLAGRTSSAAQGVNDPADRRRRRAEMSRFSTIWALCSAPTGERFVVKNCFAVVSAAASSSSSIAPRSQRREMPAVADVAVVRRRACAAPARCVHERDRARLRLAHVALFRSARRAPALEASVVGQWPATAAARATGHS